MSSWCPGPARCGRCRSFPRYVLWGALIILSLMLALKAFIFSILLVNRNYYSDGSDDISKLYRASYFLYQGDLYNAVDEIGGLEADGLPRRLAADWLADAKNRLIAVQTVQFLKAYASELATTNALA